MPCLETKVAKKLYRGDPGQSNCRPSRAKSRELLRFLKGIVGLVEGVGDIVFTRGEWKELDSARFRSSRGSVGERWSVGFDVEFRT
jgi:hypothetical protein